MKKKSDIRKVGWKHLVYEKDGWTIVSDLNPLEYALFHSHNGNETECLRRRSVPYIQKDGNYSGQSCFCTIPPEIDFLFKLELDCKSR